MDIAKSIRKLKFEKIKADYLNGNILDHDLAEKLTQAEKESNALIEEILASEEHKTDSEDL